MNLPQTVTFLKLPPHARGWTLVVRGDDDLALASPARAGMDPDPGDIPIVVPRFPRTRGDGPALSGTYDREASLPPHARGWTEDQG